MPAEGRPGPAGRDGPVVDTAPLILTLLLDAASQRHFDELRQAHFPPARNHLAAHVTLFHALPGATVDEVVADVRVAARRPPFEVMVTGLRPLGGGVAFTLASPALEALRAGLAERWRHGLSRQDRSGFRPHVTVQNKVAADAAAALLASLRDGFSPWAARADGLALWRYRGGPWDHVSTVPFAP